MRGGAAVLLPRVCPWLRVVSESADGGEFPAAPPLTESPPLLSLRRRCPATQTRLTPLRMTPEVQVERS